MKNICFFTACILFFTQSVAGELTLTEECSGELLTEQEAKSFFLKDTYFRNQDGSLVLTNIRSNNGLIRIRAQNRQCIEDQCNEWQEYYLQAPGDLFRPQLALVRGKVQFNLDRYCQGSYGHGTSCQFDNGKLTCELLKGTPQCSGWSHPTAMAKFKGVMTQNCIHLTHETKTLRLIYDVAY